MSYEWKALCIIRVIVSYRSRSIRFLFGYIDENSLKILKSLFGEQIENYRILNIEGTAYGIFRGSLFVFAMLMLMVYSLFCVKLSFGGVLYTRYPCYIESAKVKVNIDRLRPDLLNASYFYSANDEQLVIKNKASKLEK